MVFFNSQNLNLINQQKFKNKIYLDAKKNYLNKLFKN